MKDFCFVFFFVHFMCFPIIMLKWQKCYSVCIFACLSVGNDVSLSQQLDECNNNVPDGVAVVLPSAPHSKTSSNSSSPSQSLRSSPSSSPLSPSTSSASSSSDAVSRMVTELQIFGLICFLNFLTKVIVHTILWRDGLRCQLFCFCLRTLMARHAKQPSSRLAGAPAHTEKSVPLSVITGHRATLPILQPETARGERSAQFHLKHSLYSLFPGFRAWAPCPTCACGGSRPNRFKGIIYNNNTLEHSLTVFFSSTNYKNFYNIFLFRRTSFSFSTKQSLTNRNHIFCRLQDGPPCSGWLSWPANTLL